jgi:catechol 2,3-dioxygenase-like lactoylglutathione lyase family enzyme
MRIDRVDHFVLTVADVDRTVAFYRDVLGMSHATFADGRSALHFGASKINLHLAGHEFEPKARRATPGSADVCLVVDGRFDDVVAELTAHHVPIEEGPVQRTGAQGEMNSVYIRDPDGNLIELSSYV